MVKLDAHENLCPGQGGSMTVPAYLAAAMEQVWGSRGRAWVEAFPSLLQDFARRKRLVMLPPLPDLSYNYVAPALLANGTQVILKFGVPNPEMRSEIAALRLYAGDGAVRLLEGNVDEGFLMLERLRPGVPLSALGDPERILGVACGLMRRLWRGTAVPAGDAPFPTVAAWASGLGRLRSRFGGSTGPFPETLIEQAERIFAELLAAPAAPVLLHGDLHAGNILAAEREPWLAIDPKGLLGNRYYDAAVLLLDVPVANRSDPELVRALDRRLDQIAGTLGLDRQQLARWGAAQAVLSSWWTYEDHGRTGEEALRLAERLLFRS